MSNKVNAPNVLVIYDWKDENGTDQQAMIEVCGHKAYDGYPRSLEGIAVDTYFSFDPDITTDPDEFAAALTNSLAGEGYIIDDACETSPVGAILHVSTADVESDYAIHANSVDDMFVTEDDLMDLSYAIDNWASIPEVWHHDWWWISECF